MLPRLTNLFSTAAPPARTMSTRPTTTETATFASGCFWGVEHIFLKHYKSKGIVSTSVGYTGGREDAKNPAYESVCSGETDHAEAVKIVFDPEKVGYAELVGECDKPKLKPRNFF